MADQGGSFVSLIFDPDALANNPRPDRDNDEVRWWEGDRNRVTAVIDGGEFVAGSHPVPIPEGINAVGTRRITWPQMGPYIRREVGKMLAAADNPRGGQLLVLREPPTPYRAAGQTELLDRKAA